MRKFVVNSAFSNFHINNLKQKSNLCAVLFALQLRSSVHSLGWLELADAFNLIQKFHDFGRRRQCFTKFQTNLVLVTRKFKMLFVSVFFNCVGELTGSVEEVDRAPEGGSPGSAFLALAC